MAILEIRRLCKHFGGLPAVVDVDLDVGEGDVLAVIGPNGAGKSTLLKMISGLLTPSSGSVVFDGIEITGRPPHRIRHTGIATVLQTPRVFATMTTRENVALGAMFGGTGGRRSETDALAIADEVLAELELADRSTMPVGSLNLHERRTLELARALAGRPRILLLDEPMAGLNPSELSTYIGVVRHVCRELGVTVVWIEHLMKAIAALADRVFVLDFGRELARGAVEQVLTDPAVVRAYLGRGVDAGTHARGGSADGATADGTRSDRANPDSHDADADG